MKSTAHAQVPETKSAITEPENKHLSKFAGVIINGQAWNTEMTHVITTHGPMKVRLWRKVK